jgi:hypothetical protein
MVLIDLFSGQLSAISSQLRKKGRGHVHGAAKRVKEKHIDVGYEA